MKGQARFIEYILTVLLGVLVLVSVSALVFLLYNTILREQIRQGLRQITLQVSDNVMKVYDIGKASKVSPSNYSSVLLSEVNLNLPTDVSRRNYEVYLVASSPIWVNVENVTVDNQIVSTVVETSGAKVVAQTTQDPVVKVEHTMPNIDIGIQGKSVNGGGKLKYYRYNVNGTVYDTIAIGEGKILISVSTS